MYIYNRMSLRYPLISTLVAVAIATVALQADAEFTAAPSIQTNEVVGSIASGIGWQAHSYNDMRSWDQMFRKGMQYLKIDINYRYIS